MPIADFFDNFLIDLDGVVYIDNSPLDGSVETINKLRDMGKGVVFITNDPRKSPAGYSEKLSSMGILTSPSEVVTSSVAIKRHIQQHFELSGKTAFVVGTDELKEQFTQIGLILLYGEEAKSAHFVIVGGHPGFDYQEMKIATIAVRAGALFFSTNRDPVFPTHEGLVPATGAILASIEVAAGKKAISVGKPGRIIFDVALSSLSSSGKTVVVGDRLDADIEGGKNSGLSTILVMTGATLHQELKDSNIKPDYVIDDLSGLFADK